MRSILRDGIIGTSSGLAGVALTFSDVETWVRFAGELGSLVVVILTIISLIYSLRRRK